MAGSPKTYVCLGPGLALRLAFVLALVLALVLGLVLALALGLVLALVLGPGRRAGCLLVAPAAAPIKRNVSMGRLFVFVVGAVAV